MTYMAELERMQDDEKKRSSIFSKIPEGWLLHQLRQYPNLSWECILLENRGYLFGNDDKFKYVRVTRESPDDAILRAVKNIQNETFIFSKTLP